MAYTNDSDICTCEKVKGVYVVADMWGYWECCCACKKKN